MDDEKLFEAIESGDIDAIVDCLNAGGVRKAVFVKALNVCPFCNGNELTLKTLENAAGGVIFQVVCECGAAGPHADSYQDAYIFWGTRNA